MATEKRYRVIVECECDKLQDEINKLARAGWELHSVNFRGTNGSTRWLAVMEKDVTIP